MQIENKETEYSIDAILNNWFIYHPPFGTQVERYQKIREATKHLAEAVLKGWGRDRISETFDYLESTIKTCCPKSRERRFALSQLYGVDAMLNEAEDTHKPDYIVDVLRFSIMMPANAAIACNEVNEKGEK